MRLLLELKSLQNAKYDLVNNYVIQGFLYNLLRDTEFAWLHSYKGFKFFNFSNVFPVEDFRLDKTYRFVVSSPNKKLISTWYEKLREVKGSCVKLGTLEFTLKNVKKFDLKLRFPWITATPIVLKKEKEVWISNGFSLFKTRTNNIEALKEMGFKKEKIKINPRHEREVKLEELKYFDKSEFRIIKVRDIYFSFEKGDSLFAWLDALKQQSLLKYNLYTGYDFYFEEPLFDELEYRKEVSVMLRIKNRGEVIYIGTLWKKLSVMRRLDKSERNFYKFLLDTGLGNHNSLGFGFMDLEKTV